MARELLQRRAERRQIQIDSGDAGVLERLDPCPHRLRDPRLHVLPITVVFGLHITDPWAADQKDGAVGGRLVLDVQAAFGLGVDRPGRGDGEARGHQPRGERVPGTGRLVREHQGHHPVGLQGSATLGEDGRHPRLVVATRKRLRPFLALKPRRVGDRFVVLVGQLAAEEFGEDMPSGALEPDIEEVGQLGVHDIVVVGRVHDDHVNAAILDMVKAVARFARDGDRRGRIRWRGAVVEQIADTVRVGAHQRDEFLDASGGLFDGPVIAHT